MHFDPPAALPPLTRVSLLAPEAARKNSKRGSMAGGLDAHAKFERRGRSIRSRRRNPGVRQSALAYPLA
ncbi:hypothetical protein SAMN05216368_101315 [Cryobacterium flavum]|uniref:Uncharacterized protein n=1 Tax=Cryobacterium flavum TaxID=1424659 RepID=A0A5E9FU73_9MICO|nr:hypothetical protein SAMN05216368_101315 [Cryobacterium flavum]